MLRSVGSGGSKKSKQMTQNRGFEDFDKNLIHPYVLFLIEYESTNDLITLYKNHISSKNLVLELWSKNV